MTHGSRIAEWSATLLSIAGAILVGGHHVAGFYLWIPANVLWLAIGFSRRMWGLAAVYAVYTAITVWSIYSWS